MTTCAARLKIGIDGEALRIPLSGVGQYVFRLAAELESLLPNATFFAYSRLPAAALALPSPRWQLRQESNRLLRKMPSFAWLKTRGVRACRKDELDLFWAGRTIHPGLKAAKRVAVTVHDFNHRIVPETMERSTRWSHLLWFERDVRRAGLVFTNSQGTADRLWQLLARKADAIMRPGVGHHFAALSEAEREVARQTLRTHGIKNRYILAVSTLEPRKNVEALVDAFLKLRTAGSIPDHQLVLVGARGWKFRRLATKVRDAAGFGVVLPGYVADEAMPALYALADILVMPSLYEGFGMPVLEARSMGTPVITTDVPELVEAAGGTAHVVAGDAASIAEGIRAVLARDGRDRRAMHPIPRWSDSAEVFIRTLDEGAGRHESARS